MYSLLLRVMAAVIFPVMALFSFFVLLRGHHEPGGGFVGGLAAAATVGLWMLARGASEARARLVVPPDTMASFGLACAAAAALLPTFFGEPLLTSLWVSVPLPGSGHYELGSTLLFDVGVYWTVVGVVSLIILRLELRPERLVEEED